MKIMLIVAKLKGETPWIIDAWDGWAVDENPSGWRERIDKAKSDPEKEIRVAEVVVPDGFYDQIFRPVKVEGNVT